jgi:hypothetical protein
MEQKSGKKIQPFFFGEFFKRSQFFGAGCTAGSQTLPLQQ